MPRKPTRFERDIAAPAPAQYCEAFYDQLEMMLRDPDQSE